jgi:hypothetical protein
MPMPLAQSRVGPGENTVNLTFASSDPDATMLSLNGFLNMNQPLVLEAVRRDSSPIRIKYYCRMTPEQWNLIRKLAPLLERNDSERASAASVPVDGEVQRIGLDIGFLVHCCTGSQQFGSVSRTFIKFVSHAFLEIRILS